jgi:uncharacterized protein (DUF1015 family)
MAEVAPFCALRFNRERFADASLLIAPPYDVIGEGERAELERRHDRNIVRLDLPRGEGDARYGNARAELERWIGDGSLRFDAEPAIYRYVQDFRYPSGGRAYTRKGFVAMLRLTPFSERVVLPHEHTLSGPKLDRQKLIRATRAHFSQVFTLYRDPRGDVEGILEAVERAAPVLDATTPDGVRHRVWAAAEPAAIRRVAALMADKRVMIADGHHRYETMVALREELRPPERPLGASQADWGTVFFARAEDPGLLVLPTHRLVHNLPADWLATLEAKVAGTFDVARGREADAASVEARLAELGGRAVTFAVRARGSAETLWLTLRPDADLSSLGPPALQGLDVTVLHGLLLGPVLGIDAEAMKKQSFLAYTHDTAEALAKIAGGEVQGGFLMNATRVDQVLDACEAGFVLPQKSTYFLPKLATGVVMARIDAEQGPATVA